MARRRQSRVPSVAKLAGGVVVAGVCLGLLLAAAADPVMKNPAEPLWSSPGRAESAAEVASRDLFGEAPEHQRATDGYRPDFDYDEVVGAEWALPEAEAGVDLEPLPPLEEAFEAASEAEEAAAAAREAAVAQPLSEAETEADSSARKSRLVQDGLY